MKLARLSVLPLAALVLTAMAVPQASGQGDHPHYTGVQYDQGGQTTRIDGQVEEVDALAAEIAAAGRRIDDEVASHRQDLAYGQIDTEARPQRPQLVTYPAPAGIDASDQYEVSVRQGHRVEDSFVYKTDARKPDTNRGTDTSWTSFSFAGPVVVSVRKLDGEATGCRVRPTEKRIPTWFRDGACHFLLVRAANVSVEFDPHTTNPIPHAMLVFANPPETDVPDPDDPNVRYFGPGVHHLGRDVQLHSDETIYLAGGAWVEAAFVGQDLENA